MRRLVGLVYAFGLMITIFLAAFSANAQARAAADETFDHSQFDRVLHQFVDEHGYVNYTALKAQRSDLDAYVAALARTSPVSAPALFPDRASQLAYWINAYNALVLQAVIDHYPHHDLRGLLSRYKFFLRTKFVLGGEKMSLDSLENKILREQFHEPRIHFAIVCASESCPRLANEAYFPARLDAQLEARAQRFINEERSVKIDSSRNQLQLSKIFDWFKDDFLRGLPAGEKSITQYLKRYLTPERQQALEQLRAPHIEYNDYDWRINDQARSDIASSK